MDRLCDKCSVEKIKTIRDEYMVISGSSDSAGDKPIRNLAEFALLALDLVEGLHYPDGRPVKVRIGIHTGRAVAGVISQKKFAYDIWGDADNYRRSLTLLYGEKTVRQALALLDRSERFFGLDTLGADMEGSHMHQTLLAAYDKLFAAAAA